MPTEDRQLSLRFTEWIFTVIIAYYKDCTDLDLVHDSDNATWRPQTMATIDENKLFFEKHPDFLDSKIV